METWRDIIIRWILGVVSTVAYYGIKHQIRERKETGKVIEWPKFGKRHYATYKK